MADQAGPVAARGQRWVPLVMMALVQRPRRKMAAPPRSLSMPLLKRQLTVRQHLQDPPNAAAHLSCRRWTWRRCGRGLTETTKGRATRPRLLLPHPLHEARQALPWTSGPQNGGRSDVQGGARVLREGHRTKPSLPGRGEYVRSVFEGKKVGQGAYADVESE